jgi:hypothetical protein
MTAVGPAGGRPLWTRLAANEFAEGVDDVPALEVDSELAGIHIDARCDAEVASVDFRVKV